jgi:hypothetical protein
VAPRRAPPVLSTAVHRLFDALPAVTQRDLRQLWYHEDADVLTRTVDYHMTQQRIYSALRVLSPVCILTPSGSRSIALWTVVKCAAWLANNAALVCLLFRCACRTFLGTDTNVERAAHVLSAWHDTRCNDTPTPSHVVVFFDVLRHLTRARLFAWASWWHCVHTTAFGNATAADSQAVHYASLADGLFVSACYDNDAHAARWYTRTFSAAFSVLTEDHAALRRMRAVRLAAFSNAVLHERVDIMAAIVDSNIIDRSHLTDVIETRQVINRLFEKLHQESR